MRLIDADALKEEFARNEDRRGYIIGDPDDIIDNAPTVEQPTGQVNCSHCDYLNFSKKIIDIIVEVMTKYGIESVEDLQRELDRKERKNE